MKVENHVAYGCFIYENQTDLAGNFTLGDIVINKNNEVGVVIQIHSQYEFRVDQFGNTDISECRLATEAEIAAHRPTVFSDGKFLVTYSRKPTAGEIKFGHGATHYRDFHISECRHPKTGNAKKRLTAKDDGLVYTTSRH
jgi:hypothetical protein